MSESKPVAQVTSEKRPGKRRWLAVFGINSLLLSIILHVSFGVVATFLIVEHFQKKHVNFHATEPPAPHTEVEHKVELAKRNNVESAPPDLKRIVSTAVSPITLPEVPAMPQNDEVMPTAMSGVDGDIGEGMGSGLGGGGGGGGGGAPLFGALDGGGLKGFFYDTKQTPDRKPTGMTFSKYNQFMANFVSHGWNEKLFDPYFEGGTALHASSFAIAMRPSADAPKAFHLQNEVKPTFWAALYHGKVSAPEAGDYRFIGYGDNLLCVRIRKETVLDAGYTTLLPKQGDLNQHLSFEWRAVTSQKNANNPKGELKIGRVFHMEAADPVNMDVLIGDDGGACGFYLQIMKVGGTYDALPDGSPKAPFFQIGSNGPPSFVGRELYPPYSAKPEPWQDAGNQ